MSKEEEKNLADLIAQRFDDFDTKWEQKWARMEPVIKAYEEGLSLRKLFFSLMKGIGVIGAAYVVSKMAWHDFIKVVNPISE